MWDLQVRHGMIPYYMFVARDTGARHYFEIPLAQALDIYQGARKQVSGLGHTARGPSMSSGPGKICVMGKERIAGEDVFVLKFYKAVTKIGVTACSLQNTTKKQLGLINSNPHLEKRNSFLKKSMHTY